MERRILYCDECKTNYFAFIDVSKTRDYYLSRKQVLTHIIINCPYCDCVYKKLIRVKYLIGDCKIWLRKLLMLKRIGLVSVITEEVKRRYACIKVLSIIILIGLDWITNTDRDVVYYASQPRLEHSRFYWNKFAVDCTDKYSIRLQGL